jgi:hypothetical protein
MVHRFGRHARARQRLVHRRADAGEVAGNPGFEITAGPRDAPSGRCRSPP